MDANENGQHCDLDEIKREAGLLREKRIRDLREAGIPITADILSGVGKKAYQDAVDKCKPTPTTLSREQMELLNQYSPAATKRYKAADSDKED